MFSSLSRLFSASTTARFSGEPPPSTDNSAKDAPAGATIHVHPNTDGTDRWDSSKPLPLPPTHTLNRTPSYPSSLTLDRTRNGPSHVSWITGTNSPSMTSGGSPSVSPSPSRPFLKSTASIESDNVNGSQAQIDVNGAPVLRDGIWRIPYTMANAVLGSGGNVDRASYRMSSDSGSLHLQSVYLSDADTNSILSSVGAGGAGGVPGGSRPLSPIDETAQSQNQSPSDSDGKALGITNDEPRPTSDPFATPTQPLTPSSKLSATPTPTPTTPLQPQAFLTRPLKRSISQTSTSTIGTFLTPTSAVPSSSVFASTAQTHAHGNSTVSANGSAPVATKATTTAANGHVHLAPSASHLTPIIPPVDFRPSYSPSLPSPLPYPPSMRRTQLAAAPSLPTVIGSPTPHIQQLPSVSGLSTLHASNMHHHTQVSVIYESDDRRRDSAATGRSASRWRDSGRSVSFVTAPSVHFSEPESDEEEEQWQGRLDGRAGAAVEEDDIALSDNQASSTFEDIGYPNQEEYEAYLTRFKEASGERDVVESEDFGDSRSHMSLPEGYCDVEPASTPAIVISKEDYSAVEHNIDDSRRIRTRTPSWTSEFLHGGRHDYDTDTFATRHTSTLTYDLDRHSGESILETMSRHTGATDLTDSAATMVERAIQRRWFETRGVSWGSFRSFRDSVYLYTRTRWGRRALARAHPTGTQGAASHQNVDEVDAFDFEFGVDKRGQEVGWKKQAGDGRAGKRTRVWGLAKWEGRSGMRFVEVAPACLLFWLGFIAPWCWLIGGWLLSSNSGQMKESEGQFVHTVDREALWWPRRRQQPAVLRTASQKQKRIIPKERSGWREWMYQRRAVNKSSIFGPSGHGHAANVEFGETVPMTPTGVPSLDSGASTNAVYSYHLSPIDTVKQSKEARLDGNEIAEDDVNVEIHAVVDQWVRRCRIAAVTSGVVLSVVVIVVVVVVARS
ncbi:hypothetical protein BC835DRAFT_461114 [Cytidiella melzeri]|nr:hypothetical protein BC835DRAFT_461114 [Cytidiella melzeri]